MIRRRVGTWVIVPVWICTGDLTGEISPRWERPRIAARGRGMRRRNAMYIGIRRIAPMYIWRLLVVYGWRGRRAVRPAVEGEGSTALILGDEAHSGKGGEDGIDLRGDAAAPAEAGNQRGSFDRARCGCQCNHNCGGLLDDGLIQFVVQFLQDPYEAVVEAAPAVGRQGVRACAGSEVFEDVVEVGDGQGAVGELACGVRRALMPAAVDVD